MSLLENSPGFEPVLVFPEETYIDEDGNTMSRPSKTGIPTRARMQVQGQSGTSSRRAEQQKEGYESEKIYTVRFPRSFDASHGPLSAGAEIEWLGKRWAVFGDVNRSNGSRRTWHYWYRIRRR